MSGLTASAHCNAKDCTWVPDSTDPAVVDKAAAAHTKKLGHGTGVVVRPVKP